MVRPAGARGARTVRERRPPRRERSPVYRTVEKRTEDPLRGRYRTCGFLRHEADARGDLVHALGVAREESRVDQFVESRDLLGVNDITVYLFLYPILAPDSVVKSKAVWCAPDRGKAWIDYMVRDLALPAETGCATPIDKNLEYGKGKRITGTPTMFFEDGERIPGAISIADFEKKLTAAKAPAAKVSSR